VSYMHIDNFYKNQDILVFKECYALEKIHGTSAHIRFNREIKILSPTSDVSFSIEVVEHIQFFSGGENHERFVALFNQDDLLAQFKSILPEGAVDVCVYGEAYGGKCQGMSKTYGKELQFIVFEVKIGHSWLAVPDAEEVAKKLGLEFVPYEKISCTIEAIDVERDQSSLVAERRGIFSSMAREGVVLRPLFEVMKNDGTRVIAKHKRPEFAETASKREADPAKRQVLEDAQSIAQEWVTPMRLLHVLDQFPEAEIEKTGDVIRTMVADVVREAGEEIVNTKEARKAIGALAAKLFKAHLRELAVGTVESER